MSAEERRAAILAAAERVFAERGYHAASIDEVARAAGISKALIYEHFDSKLALRRSLIEAQAGDVFRRLAESAGTGEPGEVRLRKGVDAFLSFVEEHRAGFRMLYRDAADPEVAELFDALQRQAAQMVAELIAAEPAVDHEDDPGESDEMIASIITGAVQQLAIWWDDHQDVPREVLVEVVLNTAWLGLERTRAGERMRRLEPR